MGRIGFFLKTRSQAQGQALLERDLLVDRQDPIGQEAAVADRPWREGVVLVRSMHDSFIDEADYRAKVGAIAQVSV